MSARRSIGQDGSLLAREGPCVLRLWSESPDESDSESVCTLPAEPGGGRTTVPATSPPFPLRAALDRLRSAAGGTIEEATWGQYSTIVRYWERFHGGAGPDVASIDQAMLHAFFESVAEWNTATTWRRVDGQLGKLLKSCCPQSRINRLGMTEGARIASVELVPFAVIPKADWFRANRSPGASRPGGHCPKRRGSLTLDQFQGVIDAVWRVGLRGHDADYVETVLGWWWWCGMRFEQTLEALSWCDDGVSDGLDLEARMLVTAESKCGGEIRVPIPDCLVPGLRLLQRERTGPLVFYRRGLKDRAFRKAYARIWERAFPCRSETERQARHWQPHQLRSVSISTWDTLPPPACQVGWMITGHSPGTVRESAYFRPSEEVFRGIVNAYPMPRLSAGFCQQEFAFD